jgi:hypothetical protein
MVLVPVFFRIDPAMYAQSKGTGFSITESGHVLTNLHVVEGCEVVGLNMGGNLASARVLTSDAKNDLALLKTDTTTKSLAFREDQRLKLGETVIALGFPLPGVIGSSINLTTGTVSALSGIGDDSRMLQFTAPVQPGNSGGPLLDQSGHVMGIVASKLSPLWTAAHLGDLPENVNFAIKSSVVRNFLDSKGIEYATAASGVPVLVTAIADQAKSAVVAIECTPGLHLESKTAGGAPTGSDQMSNFPTRWKSMLSGTTKLIRLDGDHIYVETVLPQAAKDQGLFNLVEGKKQGQTYVGKGRSRFACQYTTGYGAARRAFTNMCSSEGAFEMTLLAPNRVEGRSQAFPQGTKYDCKKCKADREPVWQSFTWIPE